MSADVQQDGYSDPDMESELQRTVTIVFWYKENTEPIRLQHMIPTFPLFQLSRFSSLVSDLGLTTSTYLDTYNPQTGKWEQHTISSVRVVQTNQRLLYRIRKSIFDAIAEADCVSLSEEVNMQDPPSPSISSKASAASPISRKRSASGSHDEMPTAKQYIRSTHYPAEGHLAISGAHPAGPHSVSAPVGPVTPSLSGLGHQSSPTSLSISPRPPSTNLSMTPGLPSTAVDLTSNFSYQPSIIFSTTPSLTTISLPHYLVHPVSEPMFVPYHSHPPLKRWPNDYTVAQLSEGFYFLEALSTHSHVTTTLPSGETTCATTPNMTQKAAFERVFGARYVKSTICRHRGLWRRAPRELREEFEAYGEDERGIWGEFVRRIEGKPLAKTAMVLGQPEHLQVASFHRPMLQQQQQQHQQHGLGPPPPGPPPGPGPGPTMIGIPPGVPPPVTAAVLPHRIHGGAHGHPPHPGHETLVFHAMAGSAPGMMVPSPAAVAHAPPPPPSQHQQMTEENQQKIDDSRGGAGVGNSGGEGGGGGGGESQQSDSSSPVHPPHSHTHGQGIQPGMSVYDPGLTSAPVRI